MIPMNARPLGEVLRNEPAVPYEPTVGEYIRDSIRSAQDHIKTMEARYLEAKSRGLLDVKVRELRDLVGW